MTMATEFYVDEEKVPVPERPPRGAPKRGMSQALRDLDVGASLWVPNRTPKTVYGSISQAKRLEPQLRFLARKMEEGGVAGVRIWRLPEREESE